MVSLCSSGSSVIHFLDQASLKVKRSACLCFPHAGVKVMHYTAQLKLFFIMCVYVFVCGFVHVSAVLLESRRGRPIPAGAGVTGHCQPPDVGARIQTEVLCMSSTSS